MWNLLRQKACSDGEIDLVVAMKEKPSFFNDFIGSVMFNIELHDTQEVIGQCDLRLGMNDTLYYAGNIGYSIFKKYRGHHYAYKACKLLFALAKEQYYMDELLITCNPDNIASYKTCVRLGGVLKEVVDVPKNHWLIEQGDYVKCIFLFKL